MDWTPAFKCCYHCGSREIHRIRPTAFRCRSCGKHLFINPVSAVAGILLDPDDRLLLIKRSHEPAKGKLSLPGGFLDPGETAEEGLRREVREETGIEVGAVEYHCGRPNRYLFEETEYMVLDLFFAGRLETFAGAAPLDEVDAVLEIPLAEVDMNTIAFPSVKEALRLFRERRQGGDVMRPPPGRE